MSAGATELRVDRAAIRHNVATILDAAGGARLMAVVKADAYGHGSQAVARCALEAGAGALAVFSLGEGLELRRGGVDAPLLVMGPLVGTEWRSALEAGLEVCVWTPEAVAAAAAAAPPGGRAAVHLKLDTGMGRLGVRPEGVAALAESAASAQVEVVGVMTHFASADEREGENSGFMREQLLRFRAAAGALRERFPSARLHAANSAAVLRDRTTAFDMVRCGIATYGCSPFGDDPLTYGLRPAMALSTVVGAVKTLRSRESVGYGRRWRAARGAVVATLPVGYADGYPRLLGGRAEALIDGRRVPVIGTVSMNQIALDLGPEGRAAPGDQVVLLGAQGDERITAEELAGHAQTISYEIVCGLGARGYARHR